MTQTTKLAIVGAGKVGLSLAIAANRSGHYDVCVGSRSVEKAKAALRQHDNGISVLNPERAIANSDLTLITVTDSAIQTVCEQLADGFKPNSVVAHCSGALTSDELLSAKAKSNVRLASMHPLQTFPSVSAGLQKLAGTFCYYEGEESAIPAVSSLALATGMQPVAIEKSAKALYHASAVMACNYLSALMDAALTLSEHAGIGRQTLWQSLQPLVTATLENIDKVGPVDALTGPIARGDSATVKRHLAEIEKADESGALSEIYMSLGKQAADMAERRGSIDPSAADALRQLFE